MRRTPTSPAVPTSRLRGLVVVGAVAAVTGALLTAGLPAHADGVTSTPPTGEVYVLDQPPSGPDTIDAFDASGAATGTQQVSGTYPETLGYGSSIAVDGAGRLYYDDGTSSVFADGTATALDDQLDDPGSLATDRSGNVYVSDESGIERVPSTGGGSTYLATAPDGSALGGSVVATDAFGDVFVGTPHALYEYAAGSTADPTTLVTGVDVTAIAADGAGDVYYGESPSGGTEALREWVPADGSGLAETTTSPKVLDSGYYVDGLGLDAAGDLFVGDEYDYVVKELSASGTLSTFASGFDNNSSLAVYAPAPTFSADTPPATASTTAAYAGYQYAAASGDVAASSFRVASGSLPPGLSLSASGLLSGTPTTRGSYTFTVTAANAVTGSTSPSTTLTVTGPPAAGSVFVVDARPPGVVDLVSSDGSVSPAATDVDGVGPFTSGLALDAAGDLFYAVTHDDEVVEQHADGSPDSVLSTPGIQPSVLTIDAAGDVFVGGNTTVLEFAAGQTTPTTVTNSLEGVGGLAVDAAGDVYASDGYLKEIVEFPSGGGPEVVVESDLEHTRGMAFDTAGDLFVADSDGYVLEIPAGTRTTSTFASGLSDPEDVALDAAGDVYVADASGAVLRYPAAGGTPTTVTTAVANPFSIAVYAAPPAFTDGPGVLPASTAVQGQAYQTYTYTATGGLTTTFHVTSGSLPAGLSLDPTTGVLSGTPTTAGTSTFAVTAENAAAASAPLSTTITVAAPPATAGDVFVADSGANRVVEVPAGSTSSAPLVTVGSGLHYPYGLAQDAAGDLFVADSDNSRVEEIAAGTGAQTTADSALTFASGTAVDAAGDLFVADTHGNRIVEVPAGGGPQVVLASGLAGPYGVAVDPVGDVFFANTGADEIEEIPAGATVPTVISPDDLSSPFGLTTDAFGDVYVADSGHGRIVELTPPTGVVPTPGPAVRSHADSAQTLSSASTWTEKTFASGLSDPTGVAMNANGAVYVAEAGADEVVKALGTTAVPVVTGLSGPRGVTVHAPAPSFSASSAPDGTAGTAYSYTFKASAAGEPSATFRVASGSLPPGLALSTGGGLTGTPTTAGTYTFAVEAANQATGSLAPQTITVAKGAPDHLVVAPSDGATSPSITAGGSETYTAEAYDSEGEDLGDVTDATTFTMTATDGSTGTCTGATCTATVADSYTVTGTDGSATGTSALTVDPAALDHLELSPSSTSIEAGTSQAYTAEGYDEYGNDLGDETADTTFTIGGGPGTEGTCTDASGSTGASCTATVVGHYGVVGTDGTGVTGVAFLAVTPGDITSLDLSPATASITAGASEDYTVEGSDDYGNATGDLTHNTALTISGPDPKAACTSYTDPSTPPSCTATVAGTYTVTGTWYGTVTGTATLTVTAAALDHLAVSPASTSAPAGTSTAYKAEGYDAYGNDLGDVTAKTTFKLSPDGLCAKKACSATKAGAHTVTATDGTATGSGTLQVVPGAVARIAIHLSAKTAAAGTNVSVSVEGSDAYGNDVGDVSSEAGISATGGSCAGLVNAPTCEGTKVGTVSVLAQLRDQNQISARATFTVVPAALDHVVVSPGTASIAAGGSQSFAATGYDVYGNSRGDVTAKTTFTASSGVTCTGTSCTGTKTGTYTVTGKDGTHTATASLTVTPAALDHLRLVPTAPTFAAGGSTIARATGFDVYGNSLGAVTTSTTYAISPDGSCLRATCTATTPGTHTITGTDGTATGSTTVVVTGGPAAHLALSPAAAITAGGSQAFTATGTDSYGNALGDVTASTTFSIAPDGSCDGATCTATTAGPHTVTGTDGAATATITLSVTAGPLDHLGLTPASATTTAGTPESFTATGYDAYGNSLGAVTSATTFVLGSTACPSATCSTTTAGSYTVTGTDGPATGSTGLTVVPGPLSTLTVSPSSVTVVAGTAQTFAVTGADQYGNTLGDLTADSTLSISPDGSCADASCTATVAGPHAVTATDGTVSATSALTVTHDVASRVLVSSGSGQSAAEGQTYAAPLVALVTDQFGNPVAGAPVTFAVSTGAGSGTTQFGTASTAHVTSDAHGLATAPALSAGSTSGLVNVTANSGSGTLAQTSFALAVLDPTAASADLSVAIAATASGGTDSLRITVRNGGPAAAGNTSVQLTLPVGYTITDSDGGYVVGGSSVRLRLSSLPASALQVFTIVLTPTAAAVPGSFGVSVVSVSADPNATNNTASAVAPPTSG